MNALSYEFTLSTIIHVDTRWQAHLVIMMLREQASKRRNEYGKTLILD